MTAPPVVVIGDIVQDLIVRLREPLAPGSDTRAAMAAQPGGAGANMAAWLARLGTEVHLIGRVGADPFGTVLTAALRRDRVIPHLHADPARPTGQIVVLVDEGGERTMITDRGANLALTPDDLPPALFRAGWHLHLSGYTLLDAGPRPAALAALQRARAVGMTVSVDPASAALVAREGSARFLSWTAGCDLCFPNRAEGVTLSGAGDDSALASALRSHYRRVVLTLGADGALYSGPEGRYHCPALPVAVVDTTGAGDALCAGFLSAWLSGVAPPDALQRGIALAAQVVGQVGARPPLQP